MNVFVCLPLSRSACLSVLFYLSVCLSVCSTHLDVLLVLPSSGASVINFSVKVRLSVCLSFRVTVGLSFCLTHLDVFLVLEQGCICDVS